MFVALAYPYGVTAIAVVVVLANIIRFIAYQILMRKIIKISYKDIFKAHLPGIIISAVGVVGITAVHWLFNDSYPAVLLLMEILVGGIILLFFALIKPPQLLKGVIRQILTRLEEGIHKGRFGERFITWYRTRILCG